MITKISSVKMIRYSQIFEVLKCFNALKLSTLKGLLGESRFYLFFSSSGTQTLHHLLGCYATSINSSLIFFWSSLPFSNLICLAKKRLHINYDLLLQQHFYSYLKIFMFTIVYYESMRFWLQFYKFFNRNTSGFIFHFSSD